MPDLRGRVAVRFEYSDRHGVSLLDNFGAVDVWELDVPQQSFTDATASLTPDPDD